MWPGLSVKDIDEINKFMQVSSKTSMSNALFHNLESGSNELESGFSADTQPYLAKCTTRSQNSSLVYSTPSTGSPHIRLEQTTFIGHVLCFVSAIF